MNPSLRQFISRLTILLSLSFFVALPSFAQTETTTPPPAPDLLASALKTAKAENKTVFVHFGASWCGWCKRLDKFLASPEVGKLMADHYVLLSLIVQESPEKKALENLGSQEVMSEMGGEKAGLPFYFFLNQEGKKLADSLAMPKGGNIGHPANAEEIQAFITLIEKTAPRMTSEERAKIVDYLTKTMPK